MFVLGLLLLAAACVAAVELIIANHAQISFTMWNQHWHFASYWLAVIGAAIVVVGLMGLWLMSGAAARHRRIRRERKELAAENKRLAERAKATAAPAGRAGVPTNRAGNYPPAPEYAPAPGAVPAGGPAVPAGGQPVPAGGQGVPVPQGEERRGFFARHTAGGRHNDR